MNVLGRTVAFLALFVINLSTLVFQQLQCTFLKAGIEAEPMASWDRTRRAPLKIKMWMSFMLAGLAFGATDVTPVLRNEVYHPYMMSSHVDPFCIQWSGDWATVHHLWATLVDINESGEPVPRLARGWTRTKEGLTWTFDLAPNLRWSDGTPMTAIQVVQSLSASWKGTSHTELSGAIRSIKAENNSIVFNLTQAVPTLLISLSYVDWGIVHPSTLSLREGKPSVISNFPGSGPYMAETPKYTAKEKQSVVAQYRFKSNPHFIHSNPGQVPEGSLNYFDDCEILVKNKDQILTFRGFADQITPDCIKALGNEFNIFRSQPSWTHKADFTEKGRNRFLLKERQKMAALLHGKLQKSDIPFGVTPATGIIPPHLFGTLPVLKHRDIMAQLEKETRSVSLQGKSIHIVTMELWGKWKSFPWLVDALKSMGLTVIVTLLSRESYFATVYDSLPDDYDLNFFPLSVGDPDPDGTWQTASKNIYPGLIDQKVVNSAYFQTDINKRRELYEQLGEHFIRDVFTLLLRFESDHVGVHRDYQLPNTAPFRVGISLYDVVAKTR